MLLWALSGNKSVVLASRLQEAFLIEVEVEVHRLQQLFNTRTVEVV